MNRKKQIGTLVLAFLVSLTPFYSIGFLIAIAAFALWRPFRSSFFDSYIVRFVVQLLLFAALVMIVGMFGWMLQIPVVPPILLVIFGLLVLAGQRYIPNNASGKFVTFQDALSGVVAMLGISVLLVSFYLPRAPLGSTVQLITNGFDNAAHLSLIRTTTTTNGYVYGPYDAVKDQVAWKTLTAYPQGWHLANGVWWQGFGVHVFADKDLSAAMQFYVATLLGWLFVALFLFGRASLYVAERLGITKQKLKQPATVGGFVAASILVQLVLFWGSLYFGFAPFIGALAFFMLLVALLVGLHEEDNRGVYVSFVCCLIIAAAIGLSWLLPVLVALAMTGLAFYPLWKWEYTRQFGRYKKHWLLYGLTTVLALAPIAAMVFVSRSYSVQGQSQINDEGGIFAVGSLFVLLVTVFTGAVIFYKHEKGNLPTIFLAIIAPQFLFTALIFAYQLNTLGHTAYFFTKSLALCFGFMAIFFVAALMYVIHTRKLQALSLSFRALVIMCGLAGLVMLSNQDVSMARALLQRGAQMNAETAQAFAGLTKNGQLMERNVIVFTDVTYKGGDVTGNVLSTAMNTRIEPCIGNAIWLITDHRGEAFPKWINGCAVSDAQKITIITSQKTDKLITDFNNPHIQTVVAY